MKQDPFIEFHRTCVESGIHTLASVVVLKLVHEGGSYRSIAEAMGRKHGTVWRCVVSMAEQDLLHVENVPLREGSARYSCKVILSPKGLRLLDALKGILMRAPSPTPLLFPEASP